MKILYLQSRRDEVGVSGKNWQLLEKPVTNEQVFYDKFSFDACRGLCS